MAQMSLARVCVGARACGRARVWARVRVGWRARVRGAHNWMPSVAWMRAGLRAKELTMAMRRCPRVARGRLAKMRRCSISGPGTKAFKRC